MSHQNNRLLIDKIIERTVLILKDSYGSVALEDAFQMAIGEAEVHFNEAEAYSGDWPVNRAKTKIMLKELKP